MKSRPYPHPLFAPAKVAAKREGERILVLKVCGSIRRHGNERFRDETQYGRKGEIPVYCLTKSED